MTRIAALLSSAVLAGAALAAATAGTAQADVTVTAPQCDNPTTGHVICDMDPTLFLQLPAGTPVTWTLMDPAGNRIFTLTGNSTGLKGCTLNNNVYGTFSYVLSGVTYTSEVGSTWCGMGD